MITSGALRGAGDTVWPLIAIFIGSCVIRLSVGYVFVNFFGWGLAGAWYAVFIDQFIRDMIILLRFRSGRWKIFELHKGKAGIFQPFCFAHKLCEAVY